MGARHGSAASGGYPRGARPSMKCGYSLTMSEDLDALAAAWWEGDGTMPAYERVDEILTYEHDSVPPLIAALARTAPSGALPYIGTSVVEDLGFQVEEGELSGDEALSLVLASGLSPSQLFSVFAGAYASYLILLAELKGAPFSETQTAWLLDDTSPQRWAQSGQTLLRGDGFEFVPGQTLWQNELERRARTRS